MDSRTLGALRLTQDRGEISYGGGKSPIIGGIDIRSLVCPQAFRRPSKMSKIKYSEPLCFGKLF